MRWLAGGLALVGILVILFVGLKIGGEMHYRSCLQRVELEYPTSFTPEKVNQFSEGEEGGFHFFRQGDREAALTQCHSWP
jgi:hypothetical protein